MESTLTLAPTQTHEPSTPSATATRFVTPMLATPPEAPSPNATSTVIPVAEGLPTPPTAIPTAVPTIAAPPEVINILLAGNDVRWPQGGRTDALIIASINTATNSAALLSLPRDLYVYIPGWTMNRINLALPHGHGVNYPGGGGGLIADTVLYNFGVKIDHYGRVGFDTFTEVVDQLGGLEIVVNCPLTDWRLREVDLDPAIEENWAQFTLEPGIHNMDGELALWYARSRRSTSDFDRNRRQQQILRAILEQALELEVLSEIPELWAAHKDGIETDLTLSQLVRLAALAPSVRQNGVRSLTLPADAFRAWRVPTTGEAVQLFRWSEGGSTFEQLVQSPLLHRGDRPPLTVEVVTDNRVLFRQAADNLAWHGFVPVLNYSSVPSPDSTHISYYGSSRKGSFDWLLSHIFNQEPDDVELVADVDVPYDYRVFLADNYDPCRPLLREPQE